MAFKMASQDIFTAKTKDVPYESLSAISSASAFIATTFSLVPRPMIDFMEQPIMATATPSRSIARGVISVTTYSFRVIRWRNYRLALRHEINLTIFRNGDYYEAEYAPLEILSYAESEEDVIRDFQEEFTVIWRDYGLAPDEKLAPSGRKLKEKIKELVSRESSVDAA